MDTSPPSIAEGSVSGESPAIKSGVRHIGAYYTCVDTFVGPLTTYHVLVAFFGVIALFGLGVYLRGRPHSGLSII